MAISPLIALALVAVGAPTVAAGEAPPGMTWIPAGACAIGCDEAYANANERPVHTVELAGFWIDRTEVTNAQFAEFVTATGYKTTAEKPVAWEEMKKQAAPGTPRPDDATLAPGSLVFTPPSGPVADLHDYSQWWRWVNGADWRHPGGSGTGIDGLDAHPVVQVSWDDAVAYATWAGRRLPTEAEWEYAARGGLVGKRYCWGDESPVDQDGGRANIWQGSFPDRNLRVDGFAGTAPVGSFPANGYGLYDMAGNVWEWCQDQYRADAYAAAAGTGPGADQAGPGCLCGTGGSAAVERVIRGGSFLCHAAYCESYRTSARRGDSHDTGSPHIGFRCVRNP